MKKQQLIFLSAIKSCLLKWAKPFMYFFSDKIICFSLTHKLTGFLSAVSDFWSDADVMWPYYLSIVCLLRIIWLHCLILMLQFLSYCVIQLSFTPKKCVVHFALLIQITEINCIFQFDPWTPNIPIQILQPDLHKFPYRISWVGERINH